MLQFIHFAQTYERKME